MGILYFHLLLQRVAVEVVTTTQMQLLVVQVVAAHQERPVLQLVHPALWVKVMLAVMRTPLALLTVLEVEAALVLLEAMVVALTVEMVAMALQTQ